jgi:hypothetical protein
VLGASILAPVTAPSASLPVLTEPPLIFALATAVFFSCLVPSVFFPNAAKAVAPPTTRKTAIVDATNIASPGDPVKLLALAEYRWRLTSRSGRSAAPGSRYLCSKDSAQPLMQ